MFSLKFSATSCVALALAIAETSVSAAEPLPTRGQQPQAVAAAIDLLLDQRLAEAKLPASLRADDAEFLRRASLDLTGRIPTLEQARAFLDSSAPDKRQRLIDDLLSSREYSQHFATHWRNLIAPSNPVKGKAAPDRFTPWLAEQLQRSRGWDRVVYDLLTAEGDLGRDVQTSFILANSEGFQPQASLLTGSAARYFLGVQLRCAECHDHPFAEWKQKDFWGMAAFFGQMRNTSKKGPPFVLTEDPEEGTTRPAGAAIVIPSSTGKGAGQSVMPRFLQGAQPTIPETGNVRPLLAGWMTSSENPYFAQALVNRYWAQLFGRGFVNPVDDFREGNPSSHPELLHELAGEFRASGHDLKHLLRSICNSQAYQRTSRPLPDNAADRVLFSHMAIKALGPEAFYDSLSLVLGDSLPKNEMKKPGPITKPVPKVGEPPAKPGAKPVEPNGKPAPKMPESSGKLVPKKTEHDAKPAPKPPQPDVKPAPKPPQPDAKPVPKTPSPTGAGESREDFVAFFRTQGETSENAFGHGIPQFLKRMNGELFNSGSPLIARLVQSGAGEKQVIESLYLATLARRPTAEEVELMAGYLSRREKREQGYAGVLWILLNSGEFVLNR